jgi:hypothetical protein
LDKTYEQTLLGIDKEKREYAQRLFKCLSVSVRPLRVEELAEIFAVQFDATVSPFNEYLRPLDAEEAVLSACSSLIAIVNREKARRLSAQRAHVGVHENVTPVARRASGYSKSGKAARGPQHVNKVSRG